MNFLYNQTLFFNYNKKYKNIYKNKKIIGIFIHSKYSNKSTRHINKNIVKIIKSKNCIICGSGTDIEVDHKNYLYNDERVNNIKTQVIEDFQPLCKHCNIVKREKCKTKLLPPIIECLPIVPNNVEFWIDPILYVKNVVNYLSNKNDFIQI